MSLGTHPGLSSLAISALSTAMGPPNPPLRVVSSSQCSLPPPAPRLYWMVLCPQILPPSQMHPMPQAGTSLLFCSGTQQLLHGSTAVTVPTHFGASNSHQPCFHISLPKRMPLPETSSPSLLCREKNITPVPSSKSRPQPADHPSARTSKTPLPVYGHRRPSKVRFLRDF